MSLIVNPEPVKVISRASECMRRLMESGLSFDALQIPINDPAMRERLVSYWLAGAPELTMELPKTTTIACEPTPSQIRAREIMGGNFLGIEEAMRHYGAAYTEDQLTTLAEVQIDGVSGTELEVILEECKETHVLVAGFPMTILDIRKKAPSKKPKKAFRFYKDAWYNLHAFATDELVGLCWHLIRKTEVTNSRSLAFEAQKQLLGPNDYVPRACDVVYAIVLYFMETGERLFANGSVRTVTLILDGGHVDVGSFDSGGIVITSDQDVDPYDDIGLSSARKSKK